MNTRMRRLGRLFGSGEKHKGRIPRLNGGEVYADDLCTGELVSHGYCPRDVRMRRGSWYESEPIHRPGTAAGAQI
jgi:hypothetical protein